MQTAWGILIYSGPVLVAFGIVFSLAMMAGWAWSRPNAPKGFGTLFLACLAMLVEPLRGFVEHTTYFTWALTTDMSGYPSYPGWLDWVAEQFAFFWCAAGALFAWGFRNLHHSWQVAVRHAETESQ